MTDAELLEEVLRQDLPDDVREPFQNMLDGLPKWQALTQKQRAWVESVARTVGVDIGAAPAENLVSSGKMKVTDKERASLAQFQQSLGALPTLPPHRRCPLNKACMKPKGHGDQCWNVNLGNLG
jgi:hypothetical protein